MNPREKPETRLEVVAIALQAKNLGTKCETPTLNHTSTHPVHIY